MMTRSSLLIVTGTQLLLLIGGIQSFVAPFNHGRGSVAAATEGAKNSWKVWSQATDKSTSGSIGSGGSSSVGSGEAILDLKTPPRATSVLTDLVTNGSGGSSTAAAAVTKEECSDNVSSTNGKTNGDTASPVVLEEVVSKPSTTLTQKQQQSNNVSTDTKIIATDDQFIKSLPDKRSYRVITLANQLTVLLTSDPMTDVESASVHVRAGHFDDPVNRAGLAHFHEHVRFDNMCLALVICVMMCILSREQTQHVLIRSRFIPLSSFYLYDRCYSWVQRSIQRKKNMKISWGGMVERLTLTQTWKIPIIILM